MMPKIVGFIGTDAPTKPRFEWFPIVVAAASSYAMLWLASRLPERRLVSNAVAKLPEYRPEVLAKIESAIQQARDGERSAPVPPEVVERLAHLPPGRFSYDLSPATREGKKLRRYKLRTSLRGAIRSTSKASRQSEHPHLLVDTRGPLGADGTYQRAKPVLLRAYRTDGAAAFAVEGGDLDLSAKPTTTKEERAARKTSRQAQRTQRAVKVEPAPAPVPASSEAAAPTSKAKTSKRVRRPLLAPAPVSQSEVPAMPGAPAAVEAVDVDVIPSVPEAVRESESFPLKKTVRGAPRPPRKASPLVRAALAARHRGEATEDDAGEQERTTAQKKGVVLSLGGGRSGTAKVAWEDGAITTHPAAYFVKHGLRTGDGFVATIVSLQGRPVGFEEIVPEVSDPQPQQIETGADASAEPRLGVLVDYARGKARVIWDDGKISLLAEAPFYAAGIAPRALFVAVPSGPADAFNVEPAPASARLLSVQADRLHNIDMRAGKSLKGNKTSRRGNGLSPNMRWGRQAAGLLVIARDTGRALLVFRGADVLEPHTWGVPGGKCEREDRSMRDCAVREFQEETGCGCAISVLGAPVYVYREPGFEYHNFVGFVDHEFEPALDHENEDAGWFPLMSLPRPLHFGARALFHATGRDLLSMIQS